MLTFDMLPELVRRLVEVPRAPSEYRLANLFLYERRHEYQLLVGAGGSAILGRTYDGERHAMPLGLMDADRVAALLDRADCIYPLEEAEASRLCASGPFAMDRNVADSDYLYMAERLGCLADAKTKRAQARAFAREYTLRVELLAPSNVGFARQVLHGWFDDVGRASEATDLTECRDALELLEILRLSGILIFADECPVGFLIASDLRDGERVVHFAKGRRSHAGVYPWMFAWFAQNSGAEVLNFEQDLGNSGLAQSKRAFAPVAQRHKFRVRKAER
jgi:hypothetical protein